MARKEKTITINGQELPLSGVEEFESRWHMFTYHDGATPKAIIDLLAFAHITGELPTEEVLAKHSTDLQKFQLNLRFFDFKLTESQNITAQMKSDDDARFRASPLYSKKLWDLFKGGEE